MSQRLELANKGTEVVSMNCACNVYKDKKSQENQNEKSRNSTTLKYNI